MGRMTGQSVRQKGENLPLLDRARGLSVVTPMKRPGRENFDPTKTRIGTFAAATTVRINKR